MQALTPTPPRLNHADITADPEFTRLAAHDLQAPLRQAELLSDTLSAFLDIGDTANARTCARTINRTLARMRRLLHALLDFTMTANTAVILRQFDLGDAVNGALALNRLQIAEKGAQVTVGPLPKATGDPRLLTRALAILIGNAVHYVQRGTPPRLTISTRSAETNVTISVTDNGIGVPPDQQARIFEPLVRLHGPDSDYSGNGIGLSLCQKIVEAHGGQVTCRANGDGGMCFAIQLPHGPAQSDRAGG